MRKNKESKGFDYWLKVSTLERRKASVYSLKANRYIESLEGELLNFRQVVEEGKLKVKPVKGIRDKKDKYISATDSIDIGLRSLIASSEGDLLGRSFFDFSRGMIRK